MRILLLTLSVFSYIQVSAQYWIGPKVGYHYAIHDYQEESYESTYDIQNNHNFEFGLAVTYEASERYSVHGELYYERIGNRVRNKDGAGFSIDSRSSFGYISFPILMRVSLGRSPVHYYINGGPKLSYWLGGRGEIFPDEGQFEDRFRYNLVFVPRNADPQDNKYLVEDANRLQYSLTAGGGFYLDLKTGARLMVDFRYVWGHSNMGFNSEAPDVNSKTLVFGNTADIPASGYQENYEYTHNLLVGSIAYQFEYNTQLKRKGSSTNKETRKTRKSAKKKQ